VPLRVTEAKGVTLGGRSDTPMCLSSVAANIQLLFLCSSVIVSSHRSQPSKKHQDVEHEKHTGLKHEDDNSDPP
jgi:hypothetical protein